MSPTMHYPYRYWLWRAWIRWTVPLAALVWLSKRNGTFTMIWYDDNEVRLQGMKSLKEPRP